MATRAISTRSAAGEDPAFAEVLPAARRRLLTSALACFAGHGYEATRTRDISEGAGMSSGALYFHYESKESILFEISRIAHTSALERVSAALEVGAPPPDRVHAWVAEFVHWHAINSKLARVAQFELAALSADHRLVVGENRRAVRHMLRDEIQVGVKAGVFSVPDVAAAALAVLSMGIDIARWYVPGGRLGPTDLADLYSGLALQMLRHHPT